MTTPDIPEIHTLRMESELLVLQARVLRAENRSVADKVAAVQRQHQIATEQLRARIQELEDELRDLRSSRVLLTPERLDELKEAEGNLRWLVGRLGGSPAGPLLRRWAGWRNLEVRWR